MIDERVRSDAGVCLIGGGDICPEVLAKALKFAPDVVAADGGADAALAAGLTPRAAIGDLDSISGAARAAIGDERILAVDEQESTDFEKCLQRIDAPFAIAVGFDGGRLDHTLASLSVLARHVGPPTIMANREDVIFAPRGDLRLDVAPGTRVSLFPMADVTGRSKGLHWPIEGLEFAPSGRIGTSNIATGTVHLSFDAPGMLVLLPVDSLKAVIDPLRD